MDPDTGEISALAAGTCTIAVDQPGNDAYAAAEEVTQDMTIVPSDNLLPQTITLPLLDDMKVGDTETASATSDSRLDLVYSSLTSETCSVDPDTGEITALAAGTCTIAVDQDGNDTYAAAEQVTEDLTITKRAQAINNTSSVGRRVGVLTGSVTLTAESTSNLPVAFASDTSDVCTVDAHTGVVTLVAFGTCKITLSQGGNETYAAAEPVRTTFTVTPATQTVLFTPPAQLLTGSAPFTLNGAASSGRTVDYTVTSGTDVCAVSDDQVSVTGTGACVITASAAGDAIYTAAVPVSRTIQVVQPADDNALIPATTGVYTAHVIRVLDNDPANLTLTALSQPAHGTAVISTGRVLYTPDVRFRGVDHFRYQVRVDSGRSAWATVTVTVLNAVPTARDATLHQTAGTDERLDIQASDPNDDSLSLSVVHRPAGVDTSVSGLTLTVNPAAWVSGQVTITVAVHDGAGGTATARVVDTVRPDAVGSAHRSISPKGTEISWSKSETDGAEYVVRVGGQTVCHTRELSCSISRLLGPALRVTVTVLGHDGTTSDETVAVPVHGKQVLVATGVLRIR